jgi:hypothetical protein
MPSRVAKISLVQNRVKYTYQTTIKYTKWQQNIPNSRKLDKMAIKYISASPVTKHWKICPNLDFWFENIPSGNPDAPLPFSF